MAKRKKLTVIHRPGGYEAYKDQRPIRKPNAKAIMAIIGAIFSCGAISMACIGLIPVLNQAINPAPTQQVAMALSPTLAISPTNTAIPTAIVLPTDTPDVVSPLQLTMDAMIHERNLLSEQTAMPTITPVNIEPLQLTMDAMIRERDIANSLAQVITVTPFQVATLPPQSNLRATVIVDTAIVRIGVGQFTRSLGTANRGETFPVTRQHEGWVKINHPTIGESWIAGWLLRIEYAQDI